MTFDPMIITWDMLGLIGDYCGKIQLNSDKVRQSYIIKTKCGLRYWLTLQRVVVLIFVIDNILILPILTCFVDNEKYFGPLLRTRKKRYTLKGEKWKRHPILKPLFQKKKKKIRDVRKTWGWKRLPFSAAHPRIFPLSTSLPEQNINRGSRKESLKSSLTNRRFDYRSCGR